MIRSPSTACSPDHVGDIKHLEGLYIWKFADSKQVFITSKLHWIFPEIDLSGSHLDLDYANKGVLPSTVKEKTALRRRCCFRSSHWPSASPSPFRSSPNDLLVNKQTGTPNWILLLATLRTLKTNPSTIQDGPVSNKDSSTEDLPNRKRALHAATRTPRSFISEAC